MDTLAEQGRQLTLIVEPAVGRTAEEVRINLPKFTGYCTEQGMTEEQLAAQLLRIVNLGPLPFIHPKGFAGSGAYFPEHHETIMSVLRSRNIGRLGLHEREHMIDDQTTDFTPVERMLARVNNLFIAIGGIALTAAAVVEAASRATGDNRYLAWTGLGLAAISTASLAIGATAKRINPAEQRARAASNHDDNTFIWVKKRPLHQQIMHTLLRRTIDFKLEVVR